MRRNKLFFYWWPVFAWCGVIFIFSSIPTLPRVEIIWWDFLIKKTAHITEYAILYFVTFRALTGVKIKNQKSKIKITMQNVKLLENKLVWILPLVFGLLYAISDEYHQSFIMGRTSTVRDVGFDAAGLLLSWWWIKKKLKVQS